MFPEGGKIQNPSPWKPQQCQGVRVQLYPSMGLGSFPEYPTLPILIMHLLLIRVLESLAVPTVPATGGQGSKKGHPPHPQAFQKQGGRQCMPGLWAARENTWPSTSCILHLTGLTLWSGSKNSPGARRGLAVLKACVLHMPGSAMFRQSTQSPLDLSEVEKILTPDLPTSPSSQPLYWY